MKNKIAGLDFSYTSPAICIYDGSEYIFVGFRGPKKKQSSSNKNVILLEYPEKYSCTEDRFDKLTDMMFDVLIKHEITKVFLEGYSFGSMGNTFNIGEATGLMKWKLFKSGIDVEVVPPTVVKKFATDKGNAKKILMLEKFLLETDHGFKLTDLEYSVNGDKIEKPLDDLVDAYWLCKLGNSV